MRGIEIKKTAGLIDEICTNGAVVYGTGYVAERFYRALENRSLQEKIRCFVTTSGSDELFFGKSVISLDEFSPKKENGIVLVAVQESLLEEIENGLRKAGITDYVWIYPFLYDMILGEPVKRAEAVNIQTILKAERDNYQLAVRLLAIEEYYGKNEVGYSIYRKTMGLQSPSDTIEKRLRSFESLINSWERHGYDKTQTSKILTDGSILDGTHRIATAIYFGEDTIYCDIYPPTVSTEELFGAEAIMKKNFLEAAELTENEWSVLKRRQAKIYMET